MAKKKKVEEKVIEPVKKNVILDDNPSDTQRRALIKFDDENILKINYSLEDETVEVENAADGKEGEAILGVDLSYVPTLTINFVISEPLSESSVNLLRNTLRLIKRQPAAEMQLNSTYATVDPEDESFTADNILYRFTGSAYIAYVDFSNLSDYVVVKSDKVNCTTTDTATANVSITDQTKDASITYTLSLPVTPGE